MVSIRNFEGNLTKVIKDEFIDSDLIIEGGVGSGMGPLCWLRDAGYVGPFVRMDLHPQFSGSIGDEPQTWSDDENKEYENFWNVNGNCFDYELLRNIKKKFKSENPAFLTYKALSNALFDNHIDHFAGRKSESDIIPIPTAEGTLSRIYKKQLHIHPAGFGIVVSEEYAKKNRKTIKSYPQINPMPNLIVLDESGVDIENHSHYLRFKEFIKESEKSGWELYLLTDRHDALFMKR